MVPPVRTGWAEAKTPAAARSSRRAGGRANPMCYLTNAPMPARYFYVP